MSPSGSVACAVPVTTACSPPGLPIVDVPVVGATFGAMLTLTEVVVVPPWPSRIVTVKVSVLVAALALAAPAAKRAAAVGVKTNESVALS